MDERKSRTIATYNNHIREHEERFLAAIPNIQPRIDDFLAALTGKKILDLGSGPGHQSLIMKKQGFEPYCVDLSPEMIKRCEEQGIEGAVMDIENLAFPAESFDGIWASASLIHISKERVGRVLKKLHNILREKGVLFLNYKLGEGEEEVDRGEGPLQYYYWKKEELLPLISDFEQIGMWQRPNLYKDTWIEVLLRKK